MTLWVFGYGSLLWNPGIDVCEEVVASLPGWHRSFCMSSIHHRGTEEHPGLVLALDALATAVEAGWRTNWRLKTELNDNLATLHDDPRFKDIIAVIRAQRCSSSALFIAAQNPRTNSSHWQDCAGSSPVATGLGQKRSQP